MSTGDDQSDNVVDSVLSDVNDESRAQRDPLKASNERFNLLSQIAALQADLSRQAGELDERDRMLADLSEQVGGFRNDIAERDRAIVELRTIKLEVNEQRRESARLGALLDARAAEREELAGVAQSMRNERDHAQELLKSSIARYDNIEAARVQLDEKVRTLAAAHSDASRAHEERAHELTDVRAESKRLADKVEELSRSLEQAEQRAEKADALGERRATEVSYLNRRIDALTDKLDVAGQAENDAGQLRSELQLSERRVTELERDAVLLQSELDAVNKAVESLASRTSDYDELLASVNQLEDERDAALRSPSSSPSSSETEADDGQPPSVERARLLAERASELSNRRALEAAGPAEADGDSGEILQALEIEDHELIDSDLDLIPELPDMIEAPSIEAPPIEAPSIELPAIEAPSIELPAASAEPVEIGSLPRPGADAAPNRDLLPPPPRISNPQPVPQIAPPTNMPSLPPPPIAVTQISRPAPPAPSPSAPALAESFGLRTRAILPASMEPNTAQAVTHLLRQPGVTAIVDARSTCGRTGIRPSELFDRMAALRDHFDVPVEVVVTPVSTPVGGAPTMVAIGVHHVTGADTVADRVRALCMGFPADQPLVVIAGDDHVRRAAIGEEANVVEPAAVLDVIG